MKYIDIFITESPLIDAATPYLANVTDLVGNGFNFTKSAMGGYASASLDFECDAMTAWQFIGSHLGKRIVFSSPYSKNSNSICWEGTVYTVRIAQNGATVSRSMANVFNSIEVQYAERVYPGIDGAQKTTTPVTDTASIARYGKRQIRTSTGALTDADANYLAGVMKTQCANPLSIAAGTNTRPNTAGRVRVSIDCAGWWEYLDKTFHVDANTTTTDVATIIGYVIDSANTANPNLINADRSGIVANALTRTRYFAASKNVTCRAAIEEICALGDNANPFQYCFGLGADRMAYYRALDFTPEYVTLLNDATGGIYDYSTGEEIKPWLIEPGNTIWTNDLMPEGANYTYGTDEARAQMIDTVQFTAPNTVSWTPRLAADIVNLKLSRIAGGYWNTEGGWQMYQPDLGE